MIKQPPGPPSPDPRRRLLWIAAAVLAGLAVFLLLLLLPTRGPSASERWMAGQRARGERFTVEELGLARRGENDGFMDRIEVASAELLRIRQTAVIAAHGETSYHDVGGIMDGQKAVGWARPNLHAASGELMGWDPLASEVALSAASIAEVHALLEAPSLDPGWDYRLPGNRLNLVAIRALAQTLHTLAMLELHRGDLDAAHRHVQALIGMGHLHSEAFYLVNQMIRSAIVSLATDAVWELLQADGWTDPQLEALQMNLERLSFFHELSRSLEVERAVALTLYPTWGEVPTPWAAPTTQQLPLSERLHGLAWRRLWADSDLLAYLAHSQAGIDSFRRLTAGAPFLEVGSELDQAHQDLFGRITGLGKMRYWFSASAAPNFTRAIDRLVRNETGRNLAVVAVALNRYRREHGGWPRDLADLMPELLDQLPMDLYTGEPLRYRTADAGRYTLYSVGLNGQDNGGITPDDLVWALPEWPGTSP